MEAKVKFEESESKQINLKKSIIATCRQFAALSSGYLLMIVSGLHIGWGIFNPNLNAEGWTWTETDILINFVISSYYFGIFFGVLGGRSWFKTGTKAFIYQITAILSAITGIVMFVSPEQPVSIILARFLAGFAIGIAYLTLIMHCEVLPINGRGILLSFCQFFIFIGVYVAVIIVFTGNDDGKLRIIGILVFVLSGLALVCTFKFFRESPAHLIRQKNYDGAIACLLDLRNEKNEMDREVELEFNELKIMVQEDDKLGPSIVTEGNIKPLILISIVTAISLLSFNYPLNTIRFNMLAEVEHKLIIFIGILIVIRMIFGIIACNLSDILGRKKVQLISGCASGGTLIVLGIISIAKLKLSSCVSIAFFIIYELFATLGVCSITTVLMFEAFPLTKRSSSITTIVAIECLIKIILISATFDLEMTPMISEIFLFGFGGLMIGLSVYLQFRLPETMGLTMRQARDIFRLYK